MFFADLLKKKMMKRQKNISIHNENKTVVLKNTVEIHKKNK